MTVTPPMSLLPFWEAENFKSGAAAVKPVLPGPWIYIHQTGSATYRRQLRKKTIPPAPSDCCRLLSEIYNQTLVNSSASSEILSLLKQQTENAKSSRTFPARQRRQVWQLLSKMPLKIIWQLCWITKNLVICLLSSNLKDSAASAETIKVEFPQTYTSI